MTVRTRRRGHLIGTSVLLAAGLAGCGGNAGNSGTSAAAVDTGGAVTCTVAEDTRVGLATGNATGVYFALGSAYAEQVADATGNKVRVTAAETGASVQNIEQLVAGDYQVAFSLLDTAADAVAGEAAFAGKPQPIRALSRIHTNYTQVIVRSAAGIRSPADLKGKRVSTGSPKSGTEVIAGRVLTAVGLNPDTDIKAQRLDLIKTVDGMKSGTIDAMFFSGGLPTPGITDLVTGARGKVEFLDISGALPELAKLSPAYQAGAIPAATYQTPADIPTIVVPNVLLVRDDLDAELACVLTRALFDRKDALARVNPAAKELDRTRATETAPVELHRGAREALGPGPA